MAVSLCLGNFLCVGNFLCECNFPIGRRPGSSGYHFLHPENPRPVRIRQSGEKRREPGPSSQWRNGALWNDFVFQRNLSNNLPSHCYQLPRGFRRNRQVPHGKPADGVFQGSIGGGGVRFDRQCHSPGGARGILRYGTTSDDRATRSSVVGRTARWQFAVSVFYPGGTSDYFRSGYDGIGRHGCENPKRMRVKRPNLSLGSHLAPVRRGGWENVHVCALVCGRKIRDRSRGGRQ
mmetsp:Transcript_26657/g.56323  ORF Transcript_26657/g.56323 Transcript_26657/m.56323 type:complete len:234 (-) Transcript_26657:679-1380(-)